MINQEVVKGKILDVSLSMGKVSGVIKEKVDGSVPCLHLLLYSGNKWSRMKSTDRKQQ